MRDKQ
jgi:hypothetical protein